MDCSRPLLLALLASGAGCGTGQTESVPIPSVGELDPELGQSVALASAAVSAAPEDARRWLELGMTFEGGDLFAQARTCYERARELQADPKSDYRLSIVCARLGDGPAAVEAIRRALATQPDYAPAHWRLGGYLYDLGDFDGALAAYQDAGRLDPGFVGAWLGIARIQLQRGSVAEAVKLLERLNERVPDHAQVQSLLQTAYVRAGRPEEAAALPPLWMANASPGDDPWQGEFRPFRARPLIERARERLERGRVQEAAAMLESFIGSGSEDSNAHAYLARAYHLLGREEQARATVQRALARDPDNVLVLNELGLLQERGGQAGEAREIFERILRLDPLNADAASGRARLAEEGGR